MKDLASKSCLCEKVIENSELSTRTGETIFFTADYHDRRRFLVLHLGLCPFEGRPVQLP